MTYNSYVEACAARGLIKNYDEWRHALHEASSSMMPKQLRLMFVCIILHCYPSEPNVLWDKFKKQISEDFTRSSASEIKTCKKSYKIIKNILLKENKGDLFDIPEFNEMISNNIFF